MISKKARVKSYFSRPELYLSRRFDVRFRSDTAASLIRDVKGSKILDVGCGDGTVSARFLKSGAFVTFADISESMLSLAMANTPPELRCHARYLKVGLEEISESEKYDLVVAFGLIAHVDSVSEAIGKLSRLVKDGGRILIQVSDYGRFLTRILYVYGMIAEILQGHVSYEKNKVTVMDIESCANREGLEVSEIRRYGMVLPLMKAVLPDEILYRFHAFTSENSFFSKIATDAIVVLKKCRDYYD